jgi:hypothetical protein
MRLLRTLRAKLARSGNAMQSTGDYFRQAHPY